MALKTVKIPDNLMEKLEERDPADPLAALIGIVSRFIDVEPADRVLLIPDAVRRKLEIIYGRPIDATNVDRFAEAVRRTALLCVGETEVALTEGQSKAIEHEARAQGLTPSVFLSREIPTLIAQRWGY
jgi:hypothetical protein